VQTDIVEVQSSSKQGQEQEQTTTIFHSETTAQKETA